jgi:hypothetical protein
MSVVAARRLGHGMGLGGDRPTGVRRELGPEADDGA